MRFHREIGLVNNFDLRIRFFKEDLNDVRVTSIGI